LPFDSDLVHDLGADLPAGHLHVWGGPTGAGKTAFLLSLLFGAAARGRRVVYASYDLPTESLALRLLAMAARVDPQALPDPGGPVSSGGLSPGALHRATHARRALVGLPFFLLPARGFTTRSLWDRVVRMPFRPEVLAVDYLQGVVRDPETDLGATLRDLSDLAGNLHVAVIAAVRAGDEGAEDHAPVEDWTEEVFGVGGVIPDRLGWIAPTHRTGAHRAELLRNRYGERADVPLRIDAASGGVQREGDDTPRARA
jgi:hypothetical protein